MPPKEPIKDPIGDFVSEQLTVGAQVAADIPLRTLKTWKHPHATRRPHPPVTAYLERSWPRSSWSAPAGRWGRSAGRCLVRCCGPSSPAGGSVRRTEPCWGCPGLSWWGFLARNMPVSLPFVSTKMVSESNFFSLSSAFAPQLEPWPTNQTLCLRRRLN